MDIKKADGNHPVCDLNKPALNKYLISRNLSVFNPMLSRNYLLRVIRTKYPPGKIALPTYNS